MLFSALKTEESRGKQKAMKAHRLKRTTVIGEGASSTPYAIWVFDE